MEALSEEILPRLISTRDPQVRRLALAALTDRVGDLPLHDLRKVFDRLREIFNQDARTEDRSLGFMLLESCLHREDMPLEERAYYLQNLIEPASPESLCDQIKAIETVYNSKLRLEPMSPLVFRYLQSCMIKQFRAKQTARERKRSRVRNSGTVGEVSLEERGFDQLLDMMTTFVGAFPQYLDANTTANILDSILWIAEKASETSTVEQICILLKELLSNAKTPADILQRCVEDLCAIYSTTQRLQDLTRECFTQLLRHNEEDERDVLDAVMQAIKNPPPERASYTTCGAIKIARFIVSNPDKAALPELELSVLTENIAKADLTSRSINKECIRTVNMLFLAKPLSQHALKMESWEDIFKVVYAAAAICQSNETSNHQNGIDDPRSRISGPEDSILDCLHSIAHSLSGLWTACSQLQQEQISKFFVVCFNILPPGFFSQFVSDLLEKVQLNSQSYEWRQLQSQLLELFFMARESPLKMMVEVVQALRPYFAAEHTMEVASYYHSTLISLLHTLQHRRNLQLSSALGELISLESISFSISPGQFQESLSLTWPLLTALNDVGSRDVLLEVDSSLENPHCISTILVKMFLQTFHKQPEKAAMIFELLNAIAQAQHLSSNVRFPAVRLILRVRCDSTNCISVTTNPSLGGLFKALFGVEKDDTAAIANTGLTETLEKLETQAARSSNVSHKSIPGNRMSQKTNKSEKQSTRPPTFLDPQKSALPIEVFEESSKVLHLYVKGMLKESSVHIGDWLATAISVIQQPAVDWYIYSYLISHLPVQLCNRRLFAGSMPHVGMLRRIIVDQLLDSNIQDPPHDTGIRKGDIALCLFDILVILIGYSDHIERREQERIVQAFYQGIGGWERTAQFCIQALSICCHILPLAVVPRLSAILQKMSQVITQSHLTVDILEFLAGLARLRNLYVNFREEEYRMVFAICIRYLEHSRAQRTRLLTQEDIADNSIPLVANIDLSMDASVKPDLYKDIPQYVFALAYQVITVWFLSVRIGNRNDHVGWITKNLSWVDEAGNAIMEEQSQVTLDMMMRTSYLNLGETDPGDPFTPQDGTIISKTWILGLSIITIETASTTGLSRVTKRQASGTTYAVYCPQTTQLPPHHERQFEDGLGTDSAISVLPNHVLLQLTSSIAPVPAPMEAIYLSDTDALRRAISVFDRNDTVDGYKVGVIYVGIQQMHEQQILANDSGSPAFQYFLDCIGTRVKLRGAKFNTQGLDKTDDMDGTHTFAWRDRVTEIVFHVPTMMPTDIENDPHCINKKKHIGNDYVNIIWNESGRDFQFDTLRSQYNCVNIVVVPDICPSAHDEIHQRTMDSTPDDLDQVFCTIRMMTAPTFPDLSPVSILKLIPLRALPLLTRQLALQASVFSNVWIHRDTGEHASSWRNRLREIKRIRDRFANSETNSDARFSGARSAKCYTQGDKFVGKVTMGGLAEFGESLAVSLDFSRWAGPSTMPYRHAKVDMSAGYASET